MGSFKIILPHRKRYIQSVIYSRHMVGYLLLTLNVRYILCHPWRTTEINRQLWRRNIEKTLVSHFCQCRETLQLQLYMIKYKDIFIFSSQKHQFAFAHVRNANNPCQGGGLKYFGETFKSKACRLNAGVR